MAALSHDDERRVCALFIDGKSAEMVSSANLITHSSSNELLLLLYQSFTATTSSPPVFVTETELATAVPFIITSFPIFIGEGDDDGST